MMSVHLPLWFHLSETNVGSQSILRMGRCFYQRSPSLPSLRTIGALDIRKVVAWSDERERKILIFHFTCVFSDED